MHTRRSVVRTRAPIFSSFKRIVTQRELAELCLYAASRCITCVSNVSYSLAVDLRDILLLELL
ncbi:MAG: hypothetical protein ACWGMZ_13280 [Thermoguttaceae bacterium]